MRNALVGLTLAAATLLASSCTTLLGDDFEVVDATGQAGQGTGADAGGAAAAGGGGAGATGGEGGASPCEPNTTLCLDAATLRTCDAAGQPEDTPCPSETPVCVEGACVQCAGGSTSCQDHDVVECVSGEWQVQTSCTVGCDEGACLDVVDIGAGVSHTCAVLSNGTVRCWGYQKLEELNLAHLSIQGEAGSFVTTPTLVPGSANAVRVDGGNAHSCLLTADGHIACWGWNGFGQIGNGTYVDATSPAPVSTSSLVVDFSVGAKHTCVALDTGPVACWGCNDDGQIGNGQSGAGQQVNAPFELNPGFPVENVAAGQTHTCVRSTTEGLRCWGGNTFGQLGNQSTTPSTTPVGSLDSGVRRVAAGANHTTIQYLQQFATYGSNEWGQAGNGTMSDRVLSMTAPTGLGPVKQMAPGGMHTCVIDTDDALRCWGRNWEGQVGNGLSGVNQNETTPVVIDVGTVRDVATGQLHSCILTTAGEVLCWGQNNRGQLGTGDTTGHNAPTPVAW